jgi:uncharacterized protein (DUF58 family)
VLTMSAVRNNDRVGALLFTDRVEHFVPPGRGAATALRILRDVLVHEPLKILAQQHDLSRSPSIRRSIEWPRGTLAIEPCRFPR